MWDIGPGVIVAQWVMFGLASLALVVRIGACRRPQYGFWWDDLIMFISMGIFLATCITGTIAIAWGCGKFSNDVDPYILPKATLMGIIATDLGMLADAVPKVGVALIIIRLFRPQPWMRWTAIALTLLGVVFNILLVIFSFIQCHPAKYQWNRDTMAGTCWNISIYTDFAFFTGAWAAALDLVFSVYPLFVISQLKMQWRKKLAVMAVMSFGFTTFAVTTYKTAVQYPMFLHAAYDATRILANIMMWNAMGAGFTIMAGSVPTWGWMFHTRRWRNFVFWISRGRISVSPRNSGSTTPEKPLFGTVASRQTTRATANGGTGASDPPLIGPNEPPLTFPQRLHYSGASDPPGSHYSGGSSRSTNRSSDQSRRQPQPFDSIHQLERSTWYS